MRSGQIYLAHWTAGSCATAADLPRLSRFLSTEQHPNLTSSHSTFVLRFQLAPLLLQLQSGATRTNQNGS
jgi:hypothetical protein